MKIGIVGTGMVGATAAYAMVLKGVARHLVLVDKNQERAAAEADDIRHAVPFAHALDVRSGDYPQLEGSRVVLLCAGANQKPGETRMQLLQKNAAVFRDIVPRVLEHAPDAVLVVATNPVDVLTHLTERIAAERGIPAGRVLGSGTTLDTARFRTLLGQHCDVDSHHVHGLVVGEHGDSEVLTWSLVTVAGMPLEDFVQVRGRPITAAVRQEIDTRVRRAAYSIIQGKGSTYYGIGTALARIVNAVIHDERSVLTVCAPAAEVVGVRDVTLSLPRLVGGTGVLETFPLPLSETEQSQLQASATVIRKAIEDL